MTIGAAVLIVFAFAVVTVGCGSDTTDDGASRCESVPELVAQYLEAALSRLPVNANRSARS